MSEFVYCIPVKSGDIYPPVNSTIANTVTDWTTLPVNTQARYSLTDGSSPSSSQTVFAENFLYGLIIGNSSTFSLEYRKNGVTQMNQDQPIKLKNVGGITIDTSEIIYGYSVTNTYFNLWTDQSYLDNSAEVLYGRRGLYINLNKYNDWDVVETIPGSYTAYRTFLFGINNNAIYFTKAIYSDRTEYNLAAGFSGNCRVSQCNFPVRGTLRAEPINTANLEVIVSNLTNKIDQIEDQLASIEAQVQDLVPNLTKAINVETSKLYSSR